MNSFSVSVSAAQKMVHIYPEGGRTPDSSTLVGKILPDASISQNSPNFNWDLTQKAKALLKSKMRVNSFGYRFIVSLPTITPPKTAYELAVSEGFRGTLPEWLSSLQADPPEDPWSEADPGDLAGIFNTA